MVPYLAAVWRCRYFWLSLVKVDLRTRYRRSVLGLGWSLLHPLIMTTIFCAVLRPLLMPQQPLGHCALFFLSGLACWQFIVNVTVAGCQALWNGEPYIRQCPAPMAIYFLRTALASAVHFLLALAMVLVLSCWLGEASPLALLAVVPAVLLLLVLGWSLAVLAGFANVYFQDTKHLCEVGFQIVFYGTPILYEPALLQQRGLGWLLSCHPLVPVLDLVREPLLLGRVPAATTFLWAGLTVLLSAAAACLTLAGCQRRVIFHM